ncbi:hypothetical protein EFZ10_09020 [Tatumella sp. TA1]|uniref:hypothetical protein n=1 Tax=Rosenbergiella collisarenosi TaxID=1544695 RepID=UPI0008F7E821|nr:hypothetical protein [Rosenbergiella collisarenosi]MBT0720673.1 hypothetical protein [Rosenbergiella collisarenosi]QGX91752.1 hypothetical protein EFZ10_09020 [Tatumella sp. TA1]
MKNYLIKSIIGQATTQLLIHKESVTKEDILFYVSSNRLDLGIDSNQIQNIKAALNRNAIN